MKYLCYILLLTALMLEHISAFRVPDSLTLSKVKVDNSKPSHPFVDQYGRVRVFHGINRVEKGIPWYPAVLFNETRLDNLTSWGFNVIRLGTMWSGVEVGPFQVNETYLQKVDEIIQLLAKRGVYVILDMHQDVLSSKFHSYDGIPRWLIDTFPPVPPDKSYPKPFSKPPSNWELNYVTYACGEAFKHLYNNQSRALDHLGFFWQTVARRYGHYENVLGYELINEPFPGNVLTNPTLFLPGNTGYNQLQPMYDKIAPFIRDVDTKSMIFYEPVTWGMIFHGSEMGTGFTHVPGGDNYKDYSVLSFHYYCWFAGVDNQNPFPQWMRDLCDNLFFPDVLNTIYKDVADTGGGYFLTEFGQCQATAPKNSTEYQECLSVLNTADVSGVSWTYWDSVFFKPDGSAIIENVLLFSRTYTMAIAGQPLYTTYNSTTGFYTLAYLPDKDITVPTVIYASSLHYPKGFKVIISNAVYNITGNYVEVTAVDHSQGAVVTLIKL